MRMRTLTAILVLALASCQPAHAEDPNWNGDPEPPTETPDPAPAPAPTPVTPVQRTGSDRDDPLPQSRPLPCCIRNGEMVARWVPFARREKTLERCEAALAEGDALIYECERTRVVK